MYKVGDVLKTTEKYTSTGHEAKCRWFIFLGRVKWGVTPKNIFLCTTTTQISKFKANPNSVIVEFSDNSCFERDCIACLDQLETGFEEEQFVELYKPELKGRISDEKLKEIYRKLQKADISEKIKSDIINSYRIDEIKTK